MCSKCCQDQKSRYQLSFSGIWIFCDYLRLTVNSHVKKEQAIMNEEHVAIYQKICNIEQLHLNKINCVTIISNLYVDAA